jgi:hypothetical protein
VLVVFLQQHSVGFLFMLSFKILVPQQNKRLQSGKVAELILLFLQYRYSINWGGRQSSATKK